MKPVLILVAALLAARPALAQDMVGYDLSSFGKVVLSHNQVATVGDDPIHEAAFGDYNNEHISAYSATSVFARIGRSVGRLDVATDTGVFPCTAFLVADDLIMTNHHCVPGILDNPKAKATSIAGVRLVMGYVREGVTEGTESFIVLSDPVETSKELDYTILRIAGQTPGAKYGALQLASATPLDNDPYWIIGHPMGESQRISREKCRANAPALSEAKLLHTCDTMPGNSGSPVIDASSRQVVGLHHAGSANNSVNYAIPMARILEQSKVLKASASGGTAPAPPDPEAQALERLSEALEIEDDADRLAALKLVVAGAPGTSAAKTATRLINVMQPPAPPVDTGPTLVQRMTSSPFVQDCDRFAGDRFHPDRETGLMQEEGRRFVDIDAERGIAACSAALERFPGHPRMTAFLGEALYAAKRYNEAIPHYRAAAEAGDPIGQAGLGTAHLYGSGVEQSDAEAFRLLSLSADQGYAIAESSLAYMYRQGIGVAVSDQTAAALDHRAAEKGYDVAQNNLGDMYLTGDGVRKSDEQAVAWYRLAARQNNVAAQFSLGSLYYTGTGVTQSKTEAVRWLTRAADQGHATAQTWLGRLYYDGDGVAQSEARAFDLFTAAAEQDDAEAHFRLAILHLGARAIKEDADKAADHYVESLRLGLTWLIDRNSDQWLPEEARAVQRKLRDLGLYSGPVNGQIGATTRTAMRKLLP
ncbi:trypsin-like peptidase domain-containing protein [Antarctobacter jejuensis]|uniref:trypsin-like peptidase domain-containing protein n=1 Tax=Antarctobacter jejuensis TaxID=1439938 RepID=UPI003FCFDF15